MGPKATGEAAKMFDFREIEGMVFAVDALDTGHNPDVLRKNIHVLAPWQYERAMNYIYADASWTELTPRERIREEVKLMELYKCALQTVYPQKHFVLSHTPGHGVSFYQFSSDSPSTDIAPQYTRWEKVWCVFCHRQQPFQQNSEPDPEFPNADWGKCTVCGNEVLIDGWEMLLRIGPQR